MGPIASNDASLSAYEIRSALKAEWMSLILPDRPTYMSSPHRGGGGVDSPPKHQYILQIAYQGRTV